MCVVLFVTAGCTGHHLLLLSEQPGSCCPVFAGSEIWRESSRCCGLICFGLLLPFFFLNKTWEYLVCPFVNCQEGIARCWWGCGHPALYLEFLFCQCACVTWSTGIVLPAPQCSRGLSHVPKYKHFGFGLWAAPSGSAEVTREDGFLKWLCFGYYVAAACSSLYLPPPLFLLFSIPPPCLWYLHGVLTQSSPQMLCNFSPESFFSRV